MIWVLVACGYITEADRERRWDVDGDGVERPEDCDDADPAVGRPVAWYTDADADLYGDPEARTVACAAPVGTVPLAGDCDDALADTHPGAEEACDDRDNDCDGQLDEGLTKLRWHEDADGDLFGSDALSVDACEPPEGWVAAAGDCDDTDPGVNPAAEEVFDGQVADEDCDGLLDCDDPTLLVETATFWPDQDGDGWGDEDAVPVVTCAPDAADVPQGGDCDDLDPTVNPSVTWYADDDGDGYGDALDTLDACLQPVGHVANDRDCSGDADPTIHPLAREVCDGIDNNCNLAVDDADPFVTGAPRYFEDLDGDGFGNPVVFLDSCTPPGGSFVPDGEDCRDDDPARHPAAAEQCNGVDDDCDERVDDADDDVDPTTAPGWWIDADGDGYGDPDSLRIPACTLPAGTSPNGADCDDGDAGVYPNAPELCDGIDNDCDGPFDETLPDWYADLDADGWGDASALIEAGVCSPSVPGLVARTGDCEDALATVHPGAPERCDGIDNDCDLLADTLDPDGLDFLPWYFDGDDDGAGDPDALVLACEPPPNYVSTGTDCDDGDPALNPSAVEVCGGVDEDCDALVDDDDPSLVGDTWYVDADVDGYGWSGDALVACDAPPLRELDGTDCDDGDFRVHPGAREVCGGVDEDCDGLEGDADPDRDPLSGVPHWIDGDGDGYGDEPGDSACETPPGQSDLDADCDDGDPTAYPGANELCDGVDNDCVGGPDQVPPSWWPDGDGDGWGDDLATPTVDCVTLYGHVGRRGDCDDGDGAIHPDAQEVCANLRDDDCDSRVDTADDSVLAPLYWTDADGDGFGAGPAPIPICPEDLAGYPDRVPDGTDCDDGDAGVNPGAPERCDGRDQDCDALADDADPDGVIDGEDWWADTDADGFGDAAVHVEACFAPAGFVDDAADCDDDDWKIKPGATEVCDGQDNECDDLVDDADGDLQGGPCSAVCATWYYDADGDGRGAPTLPLLVCGPPPADYVPSGSDCDDADPLTFPGSVETCDAGNDDDEDCDGLVDDADPGPVAGLLAFLPDQDGDGWGDDAGPVRYACAASPGTAATGGDCDDTTAAVSPGALEVCDAGTDEDCDGLADELDPDGPGCDTGDTGAPCGTPRPVSLALDAAAGEAGTTVFTATATAALGAELSFDWGDGTVRPLGGSPTDQHTYAAAGIYDVAVVADDGCGGVGTAVVTAVVAPAGGLLVVDIGTDESDAEVYPPAGGVWLGAGLSLREALVLADTLPGVQAVGFDPALTVVSTGPSMPAFTDSAATWIAGNTGLWIDGSAGGAGNQLVVQARGVVLAGLRIRSFTALAGAIEIDLGGDSTRVVGCTLEANAIGLVSRAPDVTIDRSIFRQNGTGALPQAILSDRGDVMWSEFREGVSTGLDLTSQADGARVIGTLVEGNGGDGIRVRQQAGGPIGVVIEDSTVMGNTGSGVVLETVLSVGTVIRNTILAHNGVYGLDAEDANFASGGALDYDLFHGNTVDACRLCSSLGGSSSQADPLLADPFGGDPTPLPGSPAIDAGTDTLRDKNGALPGTYFGGAPDIGAVEVP